MENFAEYLNNGVELLVKQALKSALKNPMETAFIVKYMAAQQKVSKRRLQAEAEGLHIPPFLIASISAQCNLVCAGCYARANNSCGEAAFKNQMSDADWIRLFKEAEELGISFILLAGGEPLMRREVLLAAADFPDIVFPVFTNGTLLDDAYIQLFHKHRNLVPILSLEGDRAHTDTRRGAGVYDLLRDAMDKLRSKGILFGASITVTKENLLDVTDKAAVRSLEEAGCKVMLFVEYVPVESVSATVTAPGPEDRKVFTVRLDGLREEFEYMLFVSFPGDEEALGGCLAAGRGFFHISPTGDAEPCPFSSFSDTNLKTGTLRDAINSPLFRRLELGGFLSGEHLGGCALFGREDEIRRLAGA